MEVRRIQELECHGSGFWLCLKDLRHGLEHELDGYLWLSQHNRQEDHGGDYIGQLEKLVEMALSLKWNHDYSYFNLVSTY